jgi:hypothetical protein
MPVGYLATVGPTLSPEDSLGHAVELLHEAACGAVPVMDRNEVVGVVSGREIARGVDGGPSAPVSSVMIPPPSVAPGDLPASRALEAMEASDFPALAVVLPDGRFLGLVGRGELLAALYRRRRPATVGGMATPMGVFLSDGTHRGGVGDLALMLTGVFLFLGSLVAAALASGVERVAFQWKLYQVVPVSWIGSLVFFVAFALWFRLSWVAGYHAAEHQTVHAIERNEPLTVESVRRMPRPHPRCGTNLVVLMVLFTTMVGYLHIDALLAGIFCLVTYKFFGYWVQLHVTTRRATDEQLENGIRAGAEVLERFQAGARPARYPAFQRIWNMGIVQVALGDLIPFYALTLLAPHVPFVGALVRSLQ